MKVLVVEDNTKVCELLARVLGEEGYGVDACASGVEAASRMKSGGYDVVVLDWMLPDIEGIEVCTRVRAAGITVPILMLTARGELKERVGGLNAGADDYLVKPFEVEELLARLQALLRRSTTAGRIRVGPIEVEPVTRKVFVKDRPIDLTSKEYALVLYLAQRPDAVVPRAELLERVWDTPFDPGSNLVEVTVSRLRDKLGDHAFIIETVRGRGYRVRAQPSP